MLSPQDADAAIRAHMPCLSAELRPLAGCGGRVLRENVHAERDNPPFDRVCMDGIAVRSTALARGVRQFAVLGSQQAGAPALRLEQPEGALEVMTGAVLPEAADCVVPLEHYTLSGRIAHLHGDAQPAPYRNVQRRGVDGGRGSLMLNSGTRLGAPEIAVAASAGRPHLRVSMQPAFMVVSTGDELVEPGEPIAEHQVRRSNVYAITACLQARGFERVGNDHVPDDAGLLRERLDLHLATYDILVLSGGVSMGKFDLVPRVLQELGARQVFHRISQRPGKPMWFGVGPQGQPIFGLPGNPVSTLVCLLRYVVPAVGAAMGGSGAPDTRLALAASMVFEPPLTSFTPVIVEADDWGRPWAVTRTTNTSGDFLSLAGTDGFIELPPGPRTFERGYVSHVYRW